MRVRARRSPAVDPQDERRLVLAAVSLLLGYPDESLLGQLPVVRGAVGQMGPGPGLGLERFVEYLESGSQAELAAHYVDTFDLRLRCCLYLSYYAFGDTRKRGTALVRFAHAYRVAGFEQPAGELPDHLAVVCNFAALAPESGVPLLVEHRAGIELLRISLADSGSPYVDVVDALRSVLPKPTETDIARALDLARQGPPAEEVGLEPFAPPEYMGGERR